jgi:hypothetical protein
MEKSATFCEYVHTVCDKNDSAASEVKTFNGGQYSMVIRLLVDIDKESHMAHLCFFIE